ncbi:HNH endonuclease [bacterium]|jgi:5-methylcytosine-specific restriction endonuclease McrA|nr:HNH endonuclease [bacterium]
MIEISYNDLKLIIDNSNSMSDAARKLNISYKTLKKKTKEVGLFNPNQSRKGIKREFYEYEKNTISINDILDGKFPYYGTSKLRKRLINEGIKENKCEICGLIEWNGKDISLHLDHIDGDHTNHKLENLRILCPNCHSQTDTYCSKNKRNVKYTKTEILNAIKESNNYTDVKKKLGIGISGTNSTIKNIMTTYGINFKDSKIDDILKMENKKENIIISLLTKTKKQNIIKQIKNYCSCGKEINRNSKTCESCFRLKQRKVERPLYEILKKEVEENGYSATGRKYNVSDNCIRKWLKNNLPN